MKQYTMINLLTEQIVNVEANSRLHARIKACVIAKQHEDERCYWITKQAYHDVTGYEVLSA
ncbi:hypothetical protein P1_01 [Acinetobacter phage vB_ApiP_P1]|uniref:Uncharacterized protein n=2 Tax=Friunavirus TaxID=1985711 RepID=A0A221SBT4_9CAUD|nr:hypothetical protein FDI33_gp01 [Acinetobacter phage vB_ApiP_P1]ASN73462.1 hypothetical protein P1_01 [Acinetobacter phage vB_ApiP_P1]QYC50685.1 hypothetical protein 3043_02 [Acinetobacter phage vB_Api_3043-K38]